MSSSSSHSRSRSNSPTPTRKRIHTEVESSESFNEQDASDASSADETDSEAPQPLRVTESETTVLSHAERRRQRKKELKQLAATSESGPASKKRKLEDTTAQVQAKTATKAKAKAKATPAATSTDDPRRPKRQNSVWVGNLSFRTTGDAIRGFFDNVGTITRVHMPMRRGKQEQDENMGFAYVDFVTPDAKVIAISLSEGVLDGRNLLIKDGDDFSGRPAKAKVEASDGTGGQGDAKPESVKNAATADGKGLSKTAQKILRAQKQQPAPTLFLGNLGFETTEGSIRELFEAHRYGRDENKAKTKGVEAEELDEGDNATAKSKDVWIRKVRMGTFEDSGNCKGFAFVDFTSIEHATEALVNPRNHRLNGRSLVVEYASPDAVRRGGGPRPAKGDRDRKDTNGSAKPHTKRHQPRQTHIGREDGADVGQVAGETTEAPRSRRPDYDQPCARRAKPGAALAHAQRQSAAILPGQGQKIVF